MQSRLTGSILRLLLAAAFFFTALIPAFAQDRIANAINSSERAELHGNVHPLARAEFDQGAIRGSMMLHRMVLTFRPSATQQADLDALLAEQQNPLSPFYHQWLTPEQYADRFGMSASDIAGVVDWLRSQGFTIDETARSRTYIAFSGSSSQVESAFNTSIHQFAVNGELHYANVSDPALPWSLANVTLGIHGLNDFRPRPRGVARPRFTSSFSPFRHFLAPDDFATIYNLKPLYAAGFNGSGQSIAIMGQTDLIPSDVNTFRTVSNLPANPPTEVLVSGSASPGVVPGDILEANLDVQWAGAVAPNANIVFVKSQHGAFDSLSFAISRNIAPVISISYGDCELDFSNSEINTLVSLGQQANAQGQTIVGPSGDSGAADCDFPPNSNTQVTSAKRGLAVDMPAALPSVTGAGGTTFNDATGTFWTSANNNNQGSAISYIPEVAWNDTGFEISNGGSLASSGGGASATFSKPFWQSVSGVPADGKRDVPDISFNASFDHDGYLVCSQGSCVNGYRQSDDTLTVVGGTSAGAPVFAGILALINQKMQTSQGNVNPRLYALAGSSPNPFHDITSGDNKVPCTAGTTNCPAGTTSIGFTAGLGYDQVTGIGSVDANALVTAWAAPDFMFTNATPGSVTVTAAPTSNTGTSTVTISALNGFTGTYALNCTVSSNLRGTTCSVGPNTIVNSGTATVTVTAPTSRSSLRAPSLFPHFAPWTDGTLALAFGLVFAGKRGRSSKSRKLALVALLVFFAIVMMVGCGGGGSSSSSTTSNSQTTTTPSSVTGTGAVIVTATSGSFTRAVTINVTVN